MQNVHPSDGLRFADLAQIALGRLQVLVPEDHFRDDLQRDAASAGVGRRIMRKLVHVIFGILKSGKMYGSNYKPAFA
jgi:hypothetical protein